MEFHLWRPVRNGIHQEQAGRVGRQGQCDSHVSRCAGKLGIVGQLGLLPIKKMIFTDCTLITLVRSPGSTVVVSWFTWRTMDFRIRILQVGIGCVFLTTLLSAQKKTFAPASDVS